MDPDLPLPPYLALLSPSDPRYDGLNASAYEYAYGPNPGGGNLKAFQIVVFEQAHDAYRVWGGPASECGFWWILAPPKDCFQVCPEFDTFDYETNFAVCPEWNSMQNITRATIPPNTTAVVGVGQSANCSDGTVLYPSDSILQLNGDACSIQSLGSYESCHARPRFMQGSECIETCPDAIWPEVKPDGTYQCNIDNGAAVPVDSAAVRPASLVSGGWASAVGLFLPSLRRALFGGGARR
ncbi:hypothetical protein ACHAWF_001404 [Thalassiosira exigua]